MTAPTPSRSGLALLVMLTLGAVAGCGGGGAGGTPPPAPPTLGPGESSVTSADGKATVSVGANALQSAVEVGVAPATPDADTAADPALVANTTYAYSAPDIQVPEQVLIAIESPDAVAAGREAPQALPQGWQPPPTCLVNNVANQPAHNIFIAGTDCPASPAPACIKVYTHDNHSLCAPANEIITVPGGQSVGCPEGYHEVTGDAEFADLAAANVGQRICHRQAVWSPPQLGQSGRVPAANCTIRGGKFLCPAPKLPNGTYSVLWDKTTPPVPAFSVSTPGGGWAVFMEELGPPGVVNFRIQASDPNGLGGVELVEWADNPNPPADGSAPSLATQRWHADPALFSGPAVKAYDSKLFQLPYGPADPAKRHFYARVYDRAGNSSMQYNDLVVGSIVGRVAIDSFTVTPATVPAPGGAVTLSWNVKGAAAASIDAGVGALDVLGNGSAVGSRVVQVSADTTFKLTATHPTRSAKTATAAVTIGADSTAPTVSLSANPSQVVAPGGTTLSASASDMVGVAKVEFYRGATLIGTDVSAPYQQSASFTSADIGNAVFTARACDAANNCATSAVATVTVGADVTPPSVTLSASPGTVLLPGATTLQATATDAVGVTKVEFYRGNALIATDATAPFQHTVSFGNADLGSVSFTAKAFDAEGNHATSAAVVVAVSAPSGGDTYAGPAGVDAGNNTCAQATPCRSIAKAASLAQSGATVWLQDGTYTPATQPAPIDIPAGLTLRALTPGAAVLQRGLVLQGGATVVGLVIDRGPGDNFGTSIQASSGTVTLEGLKFTGRLGATSPPIAASGSAQVTLTPGGVADYTDTLADISQAQSAGIFAALSGNAQFTINGGSLGGKGLGGGSPVAFAQGFAAFQLTGNARLVINNATVKVDTNGILMNGAATQLSLTNSTLMSSGMQGPGRGINAAAGTPLVTLVGSTVSGFLYGAGSAPVGVGVSGAGSPNATLSFTNSVLSGGSFGLVVQDGGAPTTATITGSNLQVKNNYFGGLHCAAACNVDLAGGEVRANGTSIASLANGFSFYGGLWFGAADKAYSVKLRGVSVVDNTSLSTGNTNQPGNSGLTLAGNPASTFDLGTLASPGLNVFTGNTTGNQTSGLNVGVAAGVTVNAVGNTFDAGVQGANAQGKYVLGSAPCGVAACAVASGAGANYRVTSGSLRLAQ